MSDLNSQGKISLEFTQSGQQQLISSLGRVNEETGYTNKALTDLEKRLQGAKTATDAGANANKAYAVSANAQRYALYDVSNALGIGGAALLAFSVLSYKTAIDYQADFANVARTTQVTGAAAKSLEQNLIGLSQVTPVSYKAITDIAAMGGQLGITTSKIPEFTKTVAEFAATTNVSVDASATAFGRLNALLPDVKDNYNGLGSSILKVGINSVATESQIVVIAGRLAGIGHTVGLASHEVIGLSGALASIGVAPELAQGTITRLFTKIQIAVAGGGVALQNFAHVSGLSASQFQDSWKTNATGTLTELLNGINAAGPAAIEQIKGLGISSARDIPTLLKLSQNTDILTSSLKDAKTGFADGTQLADSFGIKAETVAAKLTVLGNNFKALLDAMGKSATGFGPLLDGANKFLIWATAVASSPVGSTIAGIVVGLIALAGIAALSGAGLLRLAATVLAVTTANGGAALSTNIFGTALGVLRTGLLGTAASSAVAAAGIDGLALSEYAAAGGASALTVGIAALAGILALGIIDKVLELSDAVKNNAIDFTKATDAAKEYQKEIALATSRSLTGNSVGKSLGLDGANPALKGGGDTRAGLLSSASYVSPQIPFVSGIVERTTGITQAKEAIAAIDASIAKLASSGHIKEASDEFLKWSESGKKLHLTNQQISDQFPLFTAAMKDGGGASVFATAKIEAETKAVKDNLASVSDGIDGTLKQESALYSLGDALGKGGNDFSFYSEAGRTNLGALQKVVTSITSQTAGDAQATANNLQGLFNALTQSAGIPAAALSFLSESIKSLGVSSITPTTTSLASFNQGLNTGQVAAEKLRSSASKAAAVVKTLVDYGNDLAGVFKRAFEIRFAGQSSLDSIASGWSAIRTSASAAADAMAKANATLAQLTSDRKINEYWLTVANAYGDTLRASEIQAKLAKNAVDTTAAQQALTTAQDDSNKSLVGNSDAAIKNRSTILGLVTNYQDYIAKLAASGVSQATLQSKSAQLKAEFIAQATQLGYNSAELATYSKAFDDVSTAIARVPRNITVTANADPALQALNEFLAKAKSAVGNGVNIPITTSEDPTAAGKASRLTTLLAEQAMLLKSLGQTSSSISPQYAQNRINSINNAIGSGNYAEGGYTGDGGKYQAAGIVHAGEFVFSAAAVRNIGVDNLAYSHSMAKRGYAEGGYVTPAAQGNGIMQLSPFDRQLLVDIRNAAASGRLTPGLIAAAGQAANTNSSNRRAS